MRVDVTDGQDGLHVSVAEVGDLKRLHVATTSGDLALISAALERSGAGRVEDDSAWLEVDYLRASGDPSDTDWQSGFGAMVDYAAAHGWVSPTGELRAHIELQEGRP